VTRQRDKQLKKAKRAFQAVEASMNARLAFLMTQEMEYERRVRNRALRLAKKRSVGYVI